MSLVSYSQEAHVRAPHTQTEERQSALSYWCMRSLIGTATPDEEIIQLTS